MYKILAAAAAAALLAASPLQAAEPKEPPISNPSGVIDNLTPEAVATMVTELGGTDVKIVKSVEGNQIVTFMDGNIPYSLGITVCDLRPGKCVAMLLLVALETGDSKYPLETLNAKNQQDFYTSAVRLDEKTVAFGHVLLADGGVTRRNLAINIGLFAVMVNDGIKFLNTQLVASNVWRPSPTQQVSMSVAGTGPVRPVFASPAQMSRALTAFSSRARGIAGRR